MIKLITKISLFLAFMAFETAKAQNVWESVGVEGGLSFYNCYYMNLTFNKFGTPYVTYQNFQNQNKTIVQRFDGVKWSPVGTSSIGTTSTIGQNIATDAVTGDPIVCHYNENNGYTNVLKYNGSTWVSLGGNNVIFGYYPVLAVSPSNVPHVAINDNNNKIQVLAFNGTTWNPLGTLPGFIPALSRFAFAFSPSGVPFVSYTDQTTVKLNVVSFSGSNWNTVGNADFSAGDNNFQNLTFDASGNPFVAYQDLANNSKTTVMSCSGGNWNLVGTAGFGSGTGTAGVSTYQSLSFDTYGVPHVSMSVGTSNAAMVYYWNGTAWTKLGNTISSGFATSYHSLKFNPLIYEPWLAYYDGYNKATIMRNGYPCTVGGVSSGSEPVINSNPTSQKSCQLNKETSSFTVDASGLGIYALWSNGANSLTMTTSTLGIYTVTVSSTCGRVSDIPSVTNTAKTPTSFTSPLAGNTICGGNYVSFSFSATGEFPLSYKWSNGVSNVNTITATTPGFYDVTVSGMCGTVVSNKVELGSAICANQNPVAVFTSSGIQFTNTTPGSFVGSSAFLFWPTYTGASTYCIRYSKSSTLVTGVVTVCGLTQAEFIFTLSTSGLRMEDVSTTVYYQVAAVDGSGNMSQWSAIQSFVVNAGQPTDLPGSSAGATKFNLYPNPASSGELKIEGNAGAQLQIFNAQGLLLLSQTLASPSSTLNTPLPSGIYLVKLGDETKKLVIE